MQHTLLQRAHALCCAVLQAKSSILVDYYLNSPDEQSKKAELEATRLRSQHAKSSYQEAYSSRRGKVLA